VIEKFVSFISTNLVILMNNSLRMKMILINWS